MEPTAKQLEIAEKIKALAAEPINALKIRFQIQAWPANFRAIVMHEVARQAKAYANELEQP